MQTRCNSSRRSDREIRIGDVEEDIAHRLHLDLRLGVREIRDGDAFTAIVRGRTVQGVIEINPPSIDNRIRTLAQLIGAPVVPNTFQVTVSVAPDAQVTAVFGAVTEERTSRIDHGDADRIVVMGHPAAAEAIVAHGHTEFQGPRYGRQDLADRGGVIEDVGKLRKRSGRC